MSTYAVGDIQGCYDCLRRLLDKAGFDPAHDRLWSVGDLVNRGPQSLQTLRFARELGDAFRGVLGNHDLHLLALLHDVAPPTSKRKSLGAILEASDRDELDAWLRRLPLLYEESLVTGKGEEHFVMMHAGLPPGWSLPQARARAAEATAALQAPDPRPFLAGMYGDHPARFDEGLTGIERLRVITNCFTRLRVCLPDGTLDLSMKEDPASAAPGYRPWFDYQPPQLEHVILFGHWAALDGRTGRDDIIGLDTGCVWGRHLSLLRLEDRELFQWRCGEGGVC